MKEQPSYLVDTDVLRNGRVSSSEWKSEPLSAEERKIGWGQVVVDRVRYSSICPKAIREDEHGRRSSRACIAAIAKAAYEKKLKLFTSPELENEQRRQRLGRTLFDVDVFDVVDFEFAPSPVPRSYSVVSLSGDKEKVADRMRREQLEFIDSIQEPRFLKIKKHLGDHLVDAFHYWTAEVQRLDGFVTSERRFHNAFDSQAKHFEPKSRVLSPIEVCEFHNFEPVDVNRNIQEKLSGLGAFAHTPVLAYAALGLH